MSRKQFNIFGWSEGEGLECKINIGQHLCIDDIGSHEIIES
jgi:hypothetical protein